MKFFLLLLLSCFSAVSAQSDCEGRCEFGDAKLVDATCSGFKVRNEKKWDDFNVLEDNDRCEEAKESDKYDFNSNYLCCAENEDECCEDYPSGFYAGFGIGVGGIAFMVLYAVYLCFGSSSAPKTEA